MKTDKSVDVAPDDPKNFVYIIFYWLGIGTLLPWNFFISVSEYWKYKFRTVNGTYDAALDNSTAGMVLNDFQMSWSSHLAVASMVPNVTMLLLNAVFGHRFKTQPRLLISLIFVIVLFIVTVTMTRIDTDSWQETFYYGTLASVVIININAAIFQGGLLGVAGKFPPKYMGGVFSGQALGGIFASGTNIVLLALGANVVNAAFYDFLIAVIFLGTALVTYLMVTRSEFFQHFADENSAKTVMKLPEDGKLLGEMEPGVALIQPKSVNLWSVFVQILFYAIAVFSIFTVTLGCFPSITVLVESSYLGTTWGDVYFIPVACFLLFNVGDFLGRTAAEFLKWPKPGRAGMIIVLLISLARFAFIPLFIFCNINDSNRNVSMTVFGADWAYFLIMSMFSLSNGYLASICMISAPQLLKTPEEQQTAASLMVALLGLGLGCGSFVSNFFVKLV